jgi:hypothetical protein
MDDIWRIQVTFSFQRCDDDEFVTTGKFYIFSLSQYTTFEIGLAKTACNTVRNVLQYR